MPEVGLTAVVAQSIWVHGVYGGHLSRDGYQMPIKYGRLFSDGKVYVN